jgi:hypothetical protein
VRLTKKRYFHMDLPSLIGLALLSMPILVFVFYIARIEFSRFIYIEGYSPPKVLKYVPDRSFNVDDPFVDIIAPGLEKGVPFEDARNVLLADGFKSVPRNAAVVGDFEPNSHLFRANWSDFLCGLMLEVALVSDADNKISSAKGNFGETGCL